MTNSRPGQARALGALGALALALAGAGLAATGAQAAVPGDRSASAEVVAGHEHGVPYLNGGVSQDQVVAMRHQAGDYNVHLVFSEGRHNDYAAGVGLRLVDEHGRTVLNLAQAGPLTDAHLPPGRYTVASDFGGQRRRDPVDVEKGRPADLYLHFAHDAPAG